jgi:hypothetical protein
VFYGRAWRGFRTKRFKYTVLGGLDGAKAWQLFDLERDPFEQENLVEQPSHYDLGAELHGLLRNALIASDDDYPMSPAFGYPALNVAASGAVSVA